VAGLWAQETEIRICGLSQPHRASRLGKIAGNKGVYLLCKDMGENVEFLAMTFWSSIEAIRKFAGEDYEKARYYPEDEKFLLNFAEKAEHFEILYDGAKDSK
jgi:hypothetical protein